MKVSPFARIWIVVVMKLSAPSRDEVIRKIVSVFGAGDAFGGYSPAQGMAIACHESGRTAAFFARARSLHPQLSSTAPDDSWDRVCEVYRPGFAPPDFFAPVASDIPTLIYAGSLDPATPTVDAFQATRFLSRVTLLEVEGAAHAPMSQDDCTRGIAQSFLAHPEVQPRLACMAGRETMEFALDGLDALLSPPSP
jgi:pimeloyl-ACP methyl ester carboxylesterase